MMPPCFLYYFRVNFLEGYRYSPEPATANPHPEAASLPRTLYRRLISANLPPIRHTFAPGVSRSPLVADEGPFPGQRDTNGTPADGVVRWSWELAAVGCPLRRPRAVLRFLGVLGAPVGVASDRDIIDNDHHFKPGGAPGGGSAAHLTRRPRMGDRLRAKAPSGWAQLGTKWAQTW